MANGHIASQATCLKQALSSDKISDQGKIHAFGIRSDISNGQSLDIKSLWVSSQTGELELKLNADLKPVREEVDAKIEVAEEVVESKDLETAPAKEDKIPGTEKLTDALKIQWLNTPVPDLTFDGPKRDATCSAWVVAPHVQYGTAWKFDENNNRICTQFKEVYRNKECIEFDTEGKCTKERFTLDENAKRFECAATKTEAPKSQCVSWKNVDNKSVCEKTEDFSAVRVCTDYTFVNNEQKCAKSDLFYPKFRCTDKFSVAGTTQCSKVEPVYPEFFCSEFEMINGHRYCKTQSPYWGERSTCTISCVKQFKVTQDNCELHCLKYQSVCMYEIELVDFGSNFFTEEYDENETFTITRKVVVIPRPLQLLNNERSIQVTDVYIPVSSAKMQGQTTILPGQIKEFAGMFGALTVDKYESLTLKKDGSKKPDGGKKPEDNKKPDGGKKPEDNKKPDGGKKPEDSKKPDGGKKPEDNKKPDGGKKPEDNKKPLPAPVCVHPDEQEVLKIMNLRKLVLTIDKDVVDSMKVITKDQKDFNTKCDAALTKSLRAKLISQFRDVIFKEYRMIKMSRLILRNAIYQSTFCPTDACHEAFHSLLADIVAHVKSYIRAVHKSAIIVNHLRRMIIKPCCCSNHWEVIHTIKKYFKTVHSCKKCRDAIIAGVKKEVKTAIAQALANFHPTVAAPAPVKITPPPKYTGVPTLTITRVLRGKEAILAYLKAHHKYFLSLIGSNASAYHDRFHSWRELYNLNKRLSEAYAYPVAQCQNKVPSALVTLKNDQMTCETALKRHRRYVRRMNRYRRRLEREHAPLVKGTPAAAKPIVVLPKMIVAPKTNVINNQAQIAAEIKRQREIAAALRRTRLAARKAAREARRKARKIARAQRRAARIAARKARRAIRRRARAQRRAALRAKLGRKLISQTLYGRKLQAATPADAALVSAIRDNISTFSPSDKKALNECLNL